MINDIVLIIRAYKAFVISSNKVDKHTIHLIMVGLQSGHHVKASLMLVVLKCRINVKWQISLHFSEFSSNHVSYKKVNMHTFQLLRSSNCL